VVTLSIDEGFGGFSAALLFLPLAFEFERLEETEAEPEELLLSCSEDSSNSKSTTSKLSIGM